MIPGVCFCVRSPWDRIGGDAPQFDESPPQPASVRQTLE